MAAIPEIGTKVKVVACLTGHDFEDDEIVTRCSAQFDYEFKDSFGFMAEDGQVWYMIPDEYEVLENN